ncbi:3-keto-5-aminohexanoate cleavage protein [Cellulomonas endophytica]|uniref:3-keto-5-aminohexanoate cleavage protein n=1 Tax=Cellulomonas endophytica TaxID=2494735 RepID=UPI0013E964BF|nr:3-keto-5-aminohexanoate cleavage protein [Cellulomonas endophytica]
MTPLQACLDGARRPRAHPALPTTPAALARDVVAVRDAGATDVHLHVKDAAGADTLDAAALEETLAAVAAALAADPGAAVTVGVTTGAWAEPDPGRRTAAVRAWGALAHRPAHASVNWHEPGAEAVARALLEAGTEVDAGLWHEAAVTSWAASPLAPACRRALLELPPDVPPAEVDARTEALLAALPRGGAPGAAVPVLLHGEDSGAWAAVRAAVRHGVLTRTGLEDVLVLPDGTPAPDNAALVRAAVTLGAG